MASRALLPDLIKFAYTTRAELRINSEGVSASRERSPDFSKFARTASGIEEGEHVLVLDFNDTSKAKKSATSGCVELCRSMYRFRNSHDILQIRVLFTSGSNSRGHEEAC
jgi:hypothetical protein